MKVPLRTLAAAAAIGLAVPTATAQDWADLARYRDGNAALVAAGHDENRVVFMGDSITEGWPAEFFEGRPWVNRGISGQTTPQMLVRFRADVLDLKPRVLLILAGTNDLAGNTGPTTQEAIVGNVASMAELARAHGIDVVLCSVLPAFDYPWRPGLDPAHKIPALNAALEEYARHEGFAWLDYFTAMDDGRNGLRAEFTADGVHPNEAGYAVMGPLAERVIADLLAR